MSLRNSQRESMQLRILLAVALDADNPRPVATTAVLPILWICDFRIASDGMRSEVQIGIDDIEAGRVFPLDIEDIKRRGYQRLAAEKSGDS